jgi:23S rRNA (guanosine2251-2'-O)-methyltransferase
VLAALKLGAVESIEIFGHAHGQIVQEITHEAEARNVPVRHAEHVEAEEDFVMQGVRAYATPPRVRTDLKSFIEELPDEPLPMMVMLDGVTDPHNFGAILRSAEGSGVTAVIVRERRQAPMTDVVVKASAGAAYFTPVFQVVNLSQTLNYLKEVGFWSVAAVGGHDTRKYWDYDWQRAVVLVVGAEGAGVSPLLLRETDDHVSIPMFGQIESLNVSVATGVLLYEAARKRAGHS